jgi:hypothetical protein
MNAESLKAKYAAVPSLFSGSDYLNVAVGKPVTFYPLCEEYTSKSTLWYLPVGVHFVNKRQVVCSQVAGAGPCYVCERIREMEKRGVPESEIFRVRGPAKYAMNVLVKGELSPRVFLAPATVAGEIVDAWKGMLDENINIFDPLASTAFTVTRSNQGEDTRYEVDCDVNSTPIVSGEDAEGRIAKILKSAANLDHRFRLSTWEEQEAVWRNR